MPFQKRPDQRRRVFLFLISQIDKGLRDAYGTRYEQGRTNQKRLAEKIGVDRSAIHRRLTSQTNLTIKSIADLVWGLDWGVMVQFFDPETEHGANFSGSALSPPVPNQPLPPLQPTLASERDNIPKELKDRFLSAA